MAEAEKQLIIVVEGTRDMLEYWSNIRSSYLEKIVRCFCGYNEEGKRVAAPSVEMALVVFTFPGFHARLVQRSSWTKDPELFLRWLKSISFIDDYSPIDFTSLTAALSETLMMFSLDPNGTPKTRHCILVAASCPDPSVIPVYRPQPSDKKQANAMTLAKTFAKYSISLSVISPNSIQMLKKIYEAGKTNSGHGNRNMQLPVLLSPNFVLLSPNFEEACVALGHIDHKQQFVQWQRERERKQEMEREQERELQLERQQQDRAVETRMVVREWKQERKREQERELQLERQQVRAVATRTITEIATAESVWCQQPALF